MPGFIIATIGSVNTTNDINIITILIIGAMIKQAKNFVILSFISKIPLKTKKPKL
jgi:hypothetical protein